MAVICYSTNRYPNFYLPIFIACVSANLLLKGLRLLSRGAWGACVACGPPALRDPSSSLSRYRRLGPRYGDLLLLLSLCDDGRGDGECVVLPWPWTRLYSLLEPCPRLDTGEPLPESTLRLVSRRGDGWRWAGAPARPSGVRLRNERRESSESDSYTRPRPGRVGDDASLGRLDSLTTGERDILRFGGESSLLLGRGLEDLEEADEADKGETDLCRFGADSGGGEASSPSSSSSSCRFLALSASLLASSSSATPFLRLQLAKTFTGVENTRRDRLACASGRQGLPWSALGPASG